MTIRSKLTRWFLIAISSVFVGFALLVSLILWRVLFNQIDHHLHTVLAEAYEIVSTHAESERDLLLQKFVSQQGMTIVLMRSNGEVVLETNSPDVAAVTEEELQRLIANARETDSEPFHFSINNSRFIVVPVVMNEGSGLLAIGYNLTIVTETFLSLLVVLLIALLLTFGLIFYGSHHVLSRYLKPLEHIANQAETVTTKKLDIHLAANQETEEVRALALAINRMLARLKDIFTKEHQFFSDAAHTLKTPLAVLRGQLETLVIPAPKRASIIASLDKSVVTIDDLLLVSRLETEPFQKVATISLSIILDELVDIARALSIEKQLTVEANIEKNVLVVANNTFLKRALSNVIQNAINYNRLNGEINITLKTLDGNAIIKIQDTGKGIPSSDLKQVRDRFFRSNHTASIAGTGLGLSITQAVIERFDGTVKIKSTVNVGTTVIITLPLTHA